MRGVTSTLVFTFIIQRSFASTNGVGLAVGEHHSLVRKQDGSLWSTGSNNYGQLGDGSKTPSFKFIQVVPSDVKAVAAGQKHSTLVKQDGSVWATGWNKYGELGDGSKTDKSSFVKVISAGAKDVAAGWFHSMVLKTDGSVWTTGRNLFGQLGDGSETGKSSFVKVISSGVKAIAAGGSHSMVLKQDNSVWAAGWNFLGQLGDHTRTSRSSFVRAVSGAKAISAGGGHSMILKQDGSLWATGLNENGQLGQNSKNTFGRVNFARIHSGGVKAIAAGFSRSAILLENDRAYFTFAAGVFVRVMSGVKAVAVGFRHSMLLLKDGSVWTAGRNDYGQLGDGSTANQDYFVRVTARNWAWGSTTSAITAASAPGRKATTAAPLTTATTTTTSATTTTTTTTTSSTTPSSTTPLTTATAISSTSTPTNAITAAVTTINFTDPISNLVEEPDAAIAPVAGVFTILIISTLIGSAAIAFFWHRTKKKTASHAGNEGDSLVAGHNGPQLTDETTLSQPEHSAAAAVNMEEHIDNDEVNLTAVATEPAAVLTAGNDIENPTPGPQSTEETKLSHPEHCAAAAANSNAAAEPAPAAASSSSSAVLASDDNLKEPSPAEIKASRMIQAQFRGYWNRSSTRVVALVERRGLAVLSAYEVSLLLAQRPEKQREKQKDAPYLEPFLKPFKKHQVTGAIFQCMSDPDDVYEYLGDEPVNKLCIRRLLRWLKTLAGDEAQRPSVLTGPEIQPVFDKGLSALSALEVEQLLSHLGLARFLSDFKKENVTGDDLQGIDMDELREISPKRTRVEYKLLLQMIRNIEAASQNPSNTSAVLRQLNVWFPGEFRTIVDPPLYTRGETTVMQATHRTYGQVVVKVVVTDDPKRYTRSKRELNFLQKLHNAKHICDIFYGKSLDATTQISARCIGVFPFYELGTVRKILDSGNAVFTTRLNAHAPACLRFKYAVAMAKDVLDGLECMHQQRIVHRDVKPANICVELLPSTTELRFAIIDLGAAVDMKVQSAESPVASATSAIGFTDQFTSVAGLKLPLGTVSFMSPEHMDGDKTVDPRSDLFSVGVTIYNCLCGRFPFVQPDAVSDPNRLAGKLVRAYERPQEADPLKVLSTDDAHPSSADQLAEVVAKSLRKERSERYQSALAMKKHIQRIDRFTELRHSLELYGLDPNHKLHPRRSKREQSQRTFASSNYRSLLLGLGKSGKKMSTWIVVRAVEEMIKIHSPENWANSFMTELDQSKKHKSFSADNVAVTAQYLWSSAKEHGTTRSMLCSILNSAIRGDDPEDIIHAVVFAHAINMQLKGNRAADPWLQKIFEKTHPYPKPLTKALQDKFQQPLPLTSKVCCTWRGGGFRDAHRGFYEQLMGKLYRVPGFLATSLSRKKAKQFISRADKAHPRILWCILIDERGATQSEFRCKHAKFVYKTEVRNEMEFLYTAYSVFKVVSTDFSTQDWSKEDSHYTVAVEAAIDNQCHDEDLPLAPWY